MSKETNKWVQQLRKLDTTIKSEKPAINILRTPSPSVNFAFAKPHHGLCAGYSMFLFGPPREGKSILTNFYIGDLHQRDPEAIVIKFDTEFKSDEQVTDDIAEKIYGIDPSRLITFQTNEPAEIFDRISTDILAMVQAGAPIRLIVLDSVSNILGRREQKNNSVGKYTIGDHAQTVQLGMKQILSTLRRHHISLIAVVQARAEQDEYARMRTGVDFRANVSYGFAHLVEYWLRVEKPPSKAARVDVFGNYMEDKNLTTMADKAELTGVKIKVTVVENFLGVSGRTGVFSFDFDKGMINQWEELAELALARGIVEKPSAQEYVLNDQSFHQGKRYYEGVRDSVELQQFIWDELVKQDKEGPKVRKVELEEAAESNDAEGEEEAAMSQKKKKGKK